MQSVSQDGILAVPRDVLNIIISLCPETHFITSLPLVCRAFNSLANDPAHWRRIARQYVHLSRLDPNDLKKSFIIELKKTNTTVRKLLVLQFVPCVNPFNTYANLMFTLFEACKSAPFEPSNSYSIQSLSDYLHHFIQVKHTILVDFLSRCNFHLTIPINNFNALSLALDCGDMQNIRILYENNFAYYDSQCQQLEKEKIQLLKEERKDCYQNQVGLLICGKKLINYRIVQLILAEPDNPTLRQQLSERQEAFRRLHMLLPQL